MIDAQMIASEIRSAMLDIHRRFGFDNVCSDPEFQDIHEALMFAAGTLLRLKLNPDDQNLLKVACVALGRLDQIERHQDHLETKRRLKQKVSIRKRQLEVVKQYLHLVEDEGKTPFEAKLDMEVEHRGTIKTINAALAEWQQTRPPR